MGSTVSSCFPEVSFAEEKFTDLYFADEAVIFTETV